MTSISANELRIQRQQIGVIFQHFNLLSSKTIFANVALPLTLQGNHSKAEIKAAVDEMLSLVGLSQFNKYQQVCLGTKATCWKLYGL